jgi:DNA-directed RNA polymerase specialized sigma24 family protein
MATIVNSLNEEWATLACSPKARRALMRWTARYPELGQVQSLDEFVNTRGRPEWAAAALRVLAIEAPDDEVAARTLLQSLLGGVVRVVVGVVRDEPDAVGEVVSIAWNRIRTYPPQRRGPVASNVLLDVRKEFSRNRATIECPVEVPERDGRFGADPAPSPEQVVCERELFDELRSAQESGMVSRAALVTIIRTRLGGESLVDVAADMHMSADAIWRRRTRAERCLRVLPLAS